MFQYRFLLTLIFLLSTLIASQAQVAGNGKRLTQTRSLGNFNELEVYLPVQMIIHADKDAPLEITTDENLFEQLIIEEKSNRLVLSGRDQLYPSQGIQISVGLSQLDKLTTSGGGSYQVKGVDKREFRLIHLSGTIMIQGKADEFRLSLETGQVEASQMVAQTLLANIWDEGLAVVTATERIEGRVENGGKLLYHGNPSVVRKQTNRGGELLAHDDSSPSVQTVASENQNVRFVLTNNSDEFINTFIQGPAGNRFGYGRPFKAGQSRDEDLPVGSKIYLVSKIGTRKLIHVVGQEYAGKDIQIFENSKPAPRVY